MVEAGHTEADLQSRLARAIDERYVVERLIGEGGMGAVFLARDRKHALRAVALKVLRPDIGAVLGAERFLAEIRIAALLNHPHIVPVFDSGEAGGLLYYVMPLVEGETLRERMRRGPRPALDEVVRIGCGIASALGYAHQQGVVHRDIKPENVMLAGDEAIVTDFGIALALRSAAGRATPVGLLLGTPGYLSPEQATGDPAVDRRADLYSLGAVLYEMVVGNTPRCWITAEDVGLGRIADAKPEARARLDALPAGFEAILCKALAAFSGDRYGSAAEIADALRSREVPLQPVDRWSVAVLPFVDRTSETGLPFLGDGLAEQLTNALARVRALRVASRTSAFAHRDRRLDVRQIGRQLGVGAVLEGSVSSAAGTLRVTVQLVDVTTGYHLWSERYDRPARDLFALQDEIALSVTRALRVILTDSERRAVTRAPTANPEAYEYYLRGRQYFHQVRKRSLEFALQMFARAIELDPSFALAHAGIADSHSLLHMYYPAAAPHLEQADDASRRALELDPDLPEAHAARGFALSQLSRTEEAAGEFETAIRLDPTLAGPRYFYARQCFQKGQMAEAARWFEDAARLEENCEARFFAAQACEAGGRHEEAIAAYRRALASAEHRLALHPDDPRAATMRAVSLCRLGEPAKGLEWARRALELDPLDAGVRYNVACLFALEGRDEDALACLEECVRLGFVNLEWIARDPDLAPLRGQPRFEALVGDPARTEVPGPMA